MDKKKVLEKLKELSKERENDNIPDDPCDEMYPCLYKK